MQGNDYQNDLKLKLPVQNPHHHTYFNVLEMCHFLAGLIK